MNYSIVKCAKYQDHRGCLYQFLRGADLPSETERFGQIYFVTFDSPSQVRGNHYHTRSSEHFGVVQGVVEVVLEDVRTKEREHFVLGASDDSYQRLVVGAYVAHAFRNVTPTAILLDYSTEQYDPADPDRNQYILIPAK